jgi:hypothetical protein
VSRDFFFPKIWRLSFSNLEATAYLKDQLDETVPAREYVTIPNPSINDINSFPNEIKKLSPSVDY